jgi:hypothetical protein
MVSFHINKMIFFQKVNSFFNFKIIQFSIILLWYCDTSSEIFKSLTYDNYNDFQHVNFIFSQNLISLFGRFFSDETNLRVN